MSRFLSKNSIRNIRKFGFDFDGVIADTNKALLNILTEYLGELQQHVDVSRFFDKDLKKVVMKNLVESSTHFLEPIEGSLETLKFLYNLNREPIIIITAREKLELLIPFFKKHSIDDLFEYKIYTEVEKGRLCYQLKLTHFVDDLVENAIRVANYGVIPILFKQYDTKEIPSLIDSLIIRINSWKSLLDFYLKEEEIE